MILKAILLIAIGILSGLLLLMDAFTLRTAALLCVCIWAFARAYYFAFYVIERYMDPGYKFAGLLSALRHLMRRK